MASNKIYYAFALPPVTGGDFVTLDHIAALRRLGFDARVYYGASDDGHAQFSVPVARPGTVFQPGDIMVVGENHPFAPLKDLPFITVMQNQNPFLTFQGFDSIAALNDFPLAHILVPSDFCAAKLREMGVTKNISRVRPGLPDYFAPRPKKLAIAYTPKKRGTEADFLKGYFAAVAPDFAAVPWISLSGMTRPACAAAMAEAAIYAAFPLLEGLGLMSLEAMASGCHIVGYIGQGGVEYATPENGDWILDGDHAGFAARLADACRLFQSGAENSRIAAGRATAAQFNHANFERELGAAWAAIMGKKVQLYRL